LLVSNCRTTEALEPSSILVQLEVFLNYLCKARIIQ